MKLDDEIYNYYEHMVIEHIIEFDLAATKGKDYLEDLTCLALNRLPPRYIRYEVDMAFYLSNEERQKMQANVKNAIRSSIEFLDKHPKDK